MKLVDLGSELGVVRLAFSDTGDGKFYAIIELIDKKTGKLKHYKTIEVLDVNELQKELVNKE